MGESETPKGGRRSPGKGELRSQMTVSFAGGSPYKQKKDLSVSLVEKMEVIKGWWKELQIKAKDQEGTANPLMMVNIPSSILFGFMVKKRLAEDK